MWGKKARIAALAVTTFALSACSANYGSIFRTFDTNNGQSIAFDANQRAVIAFRTIDNRVAFCAEPSPDAMGALSTSISAALKLIVQDPNNQVAGQLANSLATQTSEAISRRTATIQMMRDGLYRACEAHAGSALTIEEYAAQIQRYQNVILALATMEMLVDATRPPRIAGTVGGGATSTTVNGAQEQAGQANATAGAAMTQVVATPATAPVAGGGARRGHAAGSDKRRNPDCCTLDPAGRRDHDCADADRLALG